MQKEEHVSQVVAIANSTAVWVCSAAIVAVVVVQSILFVRLARKNAAAMGISPEDCALAFRTGLISSLGPAVACFVALVGLMATIGAPIAWQRLSIIGAAPTELAAVSAATAAAGLSGVQLSDPAFTMQALSVTWWTLALNGCGWLVMVALFADKLEVIREKVGGGDTHWLGVMSSAAMIGIFAFLSLNSIVVKMVLQMPQLWAAGASGAAMFLCLKLGETRPRLREYSLGIAIIVGLVAGSLG